MVRISQHEKLIEIELAYLIARKPSLKWDGIDAQLDAAVDAGVISAKHARSYRSGGRYVSLARLHSQRQEYRKSKAVKPKAAAAKA